MSSQPSEVETLEDAADILENEIRRLIALPIPGSRNGKGRNEGIIFGLTYALLVVDDGMKSPTRDEVREVIDELREII